MSLANLNEKRDITAGIFTEEHVNQSVINQRANQLTNGHWVLSIFHAWTFTHSSEKSMRIS